MKEIHVVTCFLEWEGRILLLKRSGDVGSYPGKWAGVSGYVEGCESVEERAFKEISEEVGLSKKDVELVKVGEPMAVEGTPWVVHPFLFKIKRGDIKLDWEHVEYRWISVEEIDDYDTVPQLGEALVRILSEA